MFDRWDSNLGSLFTNAPQSMPLAQSFNLLNQIEGFYPHDAPITYLNWRQSSALESLPL